MCVCMCVCVSSSTPCYPSLPADVPNYILCQNRTDLKFLVVGQLWYVQA